MFSSFSCFGSETLVKHGFNYSGKDFIYSGFHFTKEFSVVVANESMFSMKSIMFSMIDILFRVVVVVPNIAEALR